MLLTADVIQFALDNFQQLVCVHGGLWTY